MKYPKQAFDAHGGRVAEYMIVVDATIVRLCHHPRLLHAACESRDWEVLVQLAQVVSALVLYSRMAGAPMVRRIHMKLR